MRLIHRTNYWGEWISNFHRDSEVDFGAIWCQAVEDDNPCCSRGFGKRNVKVQESDLVGEHDGWWSLFLVSGARGRSPEHYFYKLALVPKATRGYGKRNCADSRGWKYLGEIHAQVANDSIECLVGKYLDDPEDISHVHIGIMMNKHYAGKGHSF
mmetsp:Transcript_16633/g.36170  ORF Transcript_16633/g.36170 Transcript_16633/m.36170 type:complete len:155 (-) Transcript_16633:605-1069(-)